MQSTLMSRQLSSILKDHLVRQNRESEASPVTHISNYIKGAVKDYLKANPADTEELVSNCALGLSVEEMVSIHILKNFDFSLGQISKEFNVSETALFNYFSEKGPGPQQLALPI